MKVVFIEPRASEANVYRKLHMPLLGPIYLATILRQRGHEVVVYNEDIYQPDYSRIQADVVGISILTSTAKRGYAIAKRFPKDKVIIGGVHASLLPEEALHYCRQVVVGEAEEVIAEVVEGLRQEPIVQGRAIKNLDTLPFPDFSLLKGYRPGSFILPVSTSRGCPFDCTFCSVTKVFGREYRFRSPENVVEELKSHKAKAVFFCDDNFAAFPKRTSSLLKLMKKETYFNWACQVRCDVVQDKELLTMMRQAGCRVVCIGLESVNPKTLEAYNKRQTLEDIVRAIKIFHRNRIKIHGMFVVGSDDDSEATVSDTLEFALRHKIDTFQMSILTPFPGTRVYSDLQSQGRIFSYDWDLYDGQHIVFTPRRLTARQLQLAVIQAYSRFYSLARFVLLVIRFHLRNAVFRLMGYTIVKKWLRQNRSLSWLNA